MQSLAHEHYSLLECMLGMYLHPALITHLPCILRLDLALYYHLKELEIEVKILSHSKQATDQRQDVDSNSHLLAKLTFSLVGKLKVLNPNPSATDPST